MRPGDELLTRDVPEGAFVGAGNAGGGQRFADASCAAGATFADRREPGGEGRVGRVDIQRDDVDRQVGEL